MAAAPRLHLHRAPPGSQGRRQLSHVVSQLHHGVAHSFGGEYLELEPGRRVRYTDRFDDPNLPGVMEVTVTLTPVSCGTELAVVQAGIPEVIPLEMCYLGWQESLEQFAALVEPEIPG